jgi:hypothetical protein
VISPSHGDEVRGDRISVARTLSVLDWPCPRRKGGRLCAYFLRAMTCIVLFAATPATAQDCLALGRACVAQCLGGQGSTATLNPVTRVLPGRIKACINRCQVAPCQPTPLTARLCDDQSICNNGFRACNDACVPSTAANQATTQSQASCATFCCTQFKQRLSQRQCDISTITVINCSENPGAAPVSGTP